MPNSPVVISASSLVTGLVLEVDGWPNRRHQASVAVGTEPLEDGSEITDHAQRQPRTQRLTGIVGTLNGAQRPRTAWETVLRLMDTNTVVEVITEWERYDEALILSAIGDTTGRDLTFALTVQEIVRVGPPIEVPELSAAARRARARAAAARRHRFDGTSEGVALNAALNASRIERAGQYADSPEAQKYLLGRFLGTGPPAFEVDTFTAQNGRNVQIVTENLPGGTRRLTFSPSDAPQRRQDPRVAEVTADLWRRHERALEAETYRLLEDPTIPSPTVDPFSGLPDPSTVTDPPQRTLADREPNVEYSSEVEANRATLAAGRGPRNPRGRVQLRDDLDRGGQEGTERVLAEAEALNV